MNLFEYIDSRVLIRDRIKADRKGGHGQLSQICRHLKIHTSLLSQILGGTRDFSAEQALDLARYFGLSVQETEYFVLLIQWERAYTKDYKEYLEQKLKHLRKESLRLSTRIEKKRELTEEQRSIFYSSWLYSAIHLFASTAKDGVSLQAICERFALTKRKAASILNFLVECDFCTHGNGLYKMSTQMTFVEKGSPHLVRHHLNWRMKSMQVAETIEDEEMMFTAQISLSKKDFALIRETMAQLIQKISKQVEASKSEDVANLNLDLFWIR